MSKIFKIVVCVSFAVITTVRAYNTCTWIGTDPANNLWTTSQNWANGTVPSNSDYGSNVILDGDQSNINKAIEISPSTAVRAITFQGATDWTINGSIYKIKYIYSNGAGTNKMSSVKSTTADLTLSISSSNTLEFTSYLLLDSRNLTIKDGGTAIFNALKNYSTAKSLIIYDAKVIVKDTWFWTNQKYNGYAQLRSETSELQYMSSVAAVETKIAAGNIYASGDMADRDLLVTDLGNGYISITVKEPSIPGPIVEIN